MQAAPQIADSGQTIALAQVARRVRVGAAADLATNMEPTVTVQAAVPGIEAKIVNIQLAPAIAEFAEAMVASYTIETGGTIEASAKGLNPIVVIFPVMILHGAQPTWERL